MKNALVIGQGLVGQAVSSELAEKGFTVASTVTNEVPELGWIGLDLTQRSSVLAVISSVRPDIVVNTGQVSSFARCEEAPDRAREVNVTGAENLVRALESVNSTARLVQLSSVSVLEDTPNAKECDAPSPNSLYGETLLKAESIVQESDLETTVLRSTHIFGPWKKRKRNERFYDLILGQKLNSKIVNNTEMNPVGIDDVARAISFLVNQAAGIYHISGDETLSHFDFVNLVAKTNRLAQIGDDQAHTRSGGNGLISTLDSGLLRSLGFNPHTLRSRLQEYAV